MRLSKRNRWFIKSFLKLMEEGVEQDTCPYRTSRLPDSYKASKRACAFCEEQFPRAKKYRICPLSCVHDESYTESYVVRKAKRLLKEDK